MGSDLETGIALALASIILGAVGLFWTIKSGLTRVERDRLAWLEGEYPKRVQEGQDKDRRISELNLELFRAYQDLARRPAAP
jgi:uncharacterized membrane protein YfbV (UPF0208 family)